LVWTPTRMPYIYPAATLVGSKYSPAQSSVAPDHSSYTPRLPLTPDVCVLRDPKNSYLRGLCLVLR